MQEYLSYWNINTPVFTRAVETRELLFTERLRPQLERLRFLCAQTQALLLITGEPGSGKTSVLRWLAHELPVEGFDTLLTAMVQREHEPGWIIPRLAAFLGVDPKVHIPSDGSLLRAVITKLDDLVNERRKLILMIDAAHFALTPGALDEIAVLLNLQALAGHCLTFVLCGREDLREVIAATPELAHKTGFHLVLPRLDVEEAKAYLRHRCQLAALPPPFSDDAYAYLHMKAGGRPALLDLYAENCLIEAFQAGARNVSLEIARNAASHLNLRETRDFASAESPPSFDPMERLPDLPPPRPAVNLRDLTQDTLGSSPPRTNLSTPPPAPQGKKSPHQQASVEAAANEPKSKPQGAQESASIKLSSLFKSEPGNK